MQQKISHSDHNPKIVFVLKKENRDDLLKILDSFSNEVVVITDQSLHFVQFVDFEAHEKGISFKSAEKKQGFMTLANINRRFFNWGVSYQYVNQDESLTFSFKLDELKTAVEEFDPTSSTLTFEYPVQNGKLSISAEDIAGEVSQ